MGYVGTITIIEANSVTVRVDANEYGELMQLDGKTIKVWVQQETLIYTVGQKIQVNIPDQIFEFQGNISPHRSSI